MVRSVSRSQQRMYKIKTFNNIAVCGLERFSRERYELGSEIADPHAILLRSHKLGSENLSPSLTAIDAW